MNLPLIAAKERGAGGGHIRFNMARGANNSHISQFPVGTYKKAHAHGPGAHVIMLSGEGYSLMWPEGEEPRRYDWQVGTMIVPPNMWFHQHFNTGTTPARYLAFKAEGVAIRNAQGVPKAWISRRLGGDQIDYADERPEVRQWFAEALMMTGDLEGAAAEITRALELDPLSAPARNGPLARAISRGCERIVLPGNGSDSCENELVGVQLQESQLPAKLRVREALELFASFYAEPADIDLCLITGAGWPFHLGGITPYLDRSGIDEVIQKGTDPATDGYSGFAGTDLRGSEHNDEFYLEGGRVRTRTNRSGGVQGGITNGETIVFRVAFKPTATIMREQHTVSVAREETTVRGRGRHDPCVLPRAVPMVEAMTALVLADHALAQQALGGAP